MKMSMLFRKDKKLTLSGWIIYVNAWVIWATFLLYGLLDGAPISLTLCALCFGVIIDTFYLEIFGEDQEGHGGFMN